jgi:SAM-dependent methyltransferase
MGEWREEWREANRASWDERVPIHVSGEFYDVAAFKAGEERLQPFEIAEVGDVSGKDLLHLQCHFGIDTLSWARRGARVTGLDFSGPAVEAARRLASEMGLEATFVQSDVYEAVDATGGKTFEVVYTGRGALNWLPDIEQWAGVVADLIRPGGFLRRRDGAQRDLRVEPHARKGNKRRERRRPWRRAAARVRLHEVRAMAHPRKIGLRLLPSARGNAPHSAHVLAAGT